MKVLPKNPLVSVICVVYNGQKYLRNCLKSVRNQTYDNIEVIIFDNNSTDKTGEMAQVEFPEFKYVKSENNLGMWPGQEKAIWQNSSGDIIVCISVDIILEPDFIEKCVNKFIEDPSIGAIQAKIYQYKLDNNKPILDKKIIDTCGFKLHHSRKLENIGHGREDSPEFSHEIVIFGIEGAVPAFRRQALEDIKIEGHFVDNDYFWYADDFDIAWRMNIFGWKQIFLPSSIAHHDRQTTKSHRKSNIDFIKIRSAVPMHKRRLDYRNTIFTIIKNDFAVNILKDIIPILLRQIELWIYFIIFETSMILEIPVIIKKLPTMLHRRRLVMAKAKISAKEFYKCLH